MKMSRISPLSIAVIVAMVVFIIPLEVSNMLLHEDGVWIELYGDKAGRGGEWCEATVSNARHFIMEPMNARSDYCYVVLGCWMIVLSVLDYRSKNNEHNKILSVVAVHHNLEIPVDTIVEDGETAVPESNTEGKDNEVPNGLLRFPHISLVNGIFNTLHGLGSFWNHACQCPYGGTADVAGMLSVTAFPLLYMPLQVATGNTHQYSIRTQWLLSMLPVLGQALVWIGTLYDLWPMYPFFITQMTITVLGIPVVNLYLVHWRNKNNRHNNDDRCYSHAPRLRLLPLCVLLFFAGWVCWQLDASGTWCFDDNASPLRWFPGHAFWHFFTCGALASAYLFYRTERLLVKKVGSEET